ncbi:hypothetical protein M9H77_18844 [Catharanthus roseus]|uniref:Uncharacterized protein n=1 Tax=Catharanthus roseus TaxID=4058 RepID=A0ACC0B8L7_CATRO|nr:hypothetical protein M9H77_18844 [Catharanthus roseus]
MTVRYHVINPSAAPPPFFFLFLLPPYFFFLSFSCLLISSFLLSSFFSSLKIFSLLLILFSLHPKIVILCSSGLAAPPQSLLLLRRRRRLMEEVPVHVHPGPIVPGVLSRQHEHQSDLIWSGDHETCFTDLQCRRFGRNLFQCYSTAPRRLADLLAPLSSIWCTSFDCSQLPMHTLVTYRDQLDFMLSDQLRRNDHTYWATQHASHVEAWVQWRLHVRDGSALAVEVLSYSSDEYIRWYRGITRVYIGNPANRDTRSFGYQLAGDVDDMSSVVIQEPPSSPSQMAVFVKKVETIIRMCMVSIGGTLGCTPSQHDIQQMFPIQPSRRLSREHVPNLGIPSFSLGLTPPSQSLPSESGTLQMPPPSGLGFAPFQSPYPTFQFSRFRAPLLRAQLVHLHRISLYRRHLYLMKRSRRMTWMLYSILDSDIVLVRRQ